MFSFCKSILLVWKNTFLYENICFMSDNFPLFIFLCVVKNQELSLLWKEGMEQLGLEEPKHGSLVVPDRQVQKDSLTSSWSTHVDLPGKLFWNNHVLLCMLLFFVKTLCMVAFLLALLFLRKRCFNWLIEYLLSRTFFLMKEC